MDTLSSELDETALVAEAERISALLAEHAAVHDRDASFPAEGRDAVASSPIATMLQDGASWATFGEVVKILCRGDASFGTAWLMHQGAAHTLASLAEREQRAVIERGLRGGAWFANALSEPTSGNRFLVPLQVAHQADGGWRFSGTRRFVSGCEHASYFLISALCGGVPTFFLIDRDDSITIEVVWDTMGMRATRSQMVHFADTLLPADRRLDIRTTDINAIGAGLPWISVGIAEAAFGHAVSYAKQRTLPPDDRPLAALQWVQFAVADMSLRLEAARALAMRASQAADQGDAMAGMLQIQAKAVANEAATAIASAALELCGGSGYFRSNALERIARDAMSGPIMAWSTAVIRDVLGKAILGVGGG